MTVEQRVFVKRANEDAFLDRRGKSLYNQKNSIFYAPENKSPGNFCFLKSGLFIGKPRKSCETDRQSERKGFDSDGKS